MVVPEPGRWLLVRCFFRASVACLRPCCCVCWGRDSAVLFGVGVGVLSDGDDDDALLFPPGDGSSRDCALERDCDDSLAISYTSQMRCCPLEYTNVLRRTLERFLALLSSSKSLMSAVLCIKTMIGQC